MGLKTLTVILGTSAMAVTAVTALAASASFRCPCCAGGADPDEGRRDQYEQARRMYRHANTLIKGIEARNKGIPSEQWQPGDQVMHRNSTGLVRELIQTHPRLVQEQAANAVIDYQSIPYEQIYGPPQGER